MLSDPRLPVYALSCVTVAGVILRPFKLPEWIFAVGGAVLLPVTGVLAPAEALTGIRSGTDVYLFLAGMMLLAEIARREGLFEVIAALAARHANGSAKRLFTLVFLVGTLVTVFLSNDATAVVLTPAVAAVARAAGAAPIPYLLVCAFVANAASFVLPISNPANLVIFGDRMPALGDWLTRFTLPSLAAILVTYLVLTHTQRADLAGTVKTDIEQPAMSRGATIAAFGIAAAAGVLLVASALGLALGWPTALAGLTTLAAVSVGERASPLPALAGVGWTTLLLVAGLFVIVRALELTGLETLLADALQSTLRDGEGFASFAVGALLGLATNLTNNLPLGLLAGSVVAAAEVPASTIDSILVGIDLGPNLSVTGSLATILWLLALEREGLRFGAWRFLKLGFLVMTPALLAALAIVWLQA